MKKANDQSIKCVIVDDEAMATKVIEAHLGHIPNFEIEGIYHSAVEAFLALESLEVDVLFLDIQMPKVAGIEMLKMIKHKPLTVLTTAHREYALDGFELEVVDYLLKPIGLNRFLQTISRLKKRLSIPTAKTEQVSHPAEKTREVNKQDTAPQHIFIKTNRAYQRIEIAAILHIEAIKNHIKIVTKEGNYISLISLSEFEKQLPEAFVRVHRSFIVNINNVLKFDNYEISNEKSTIPIGRTYKERAVELLKNLTN
ncbi:MAG: LytTR family DNA-binding domain-containing protein [Bacteroidota bacterium]